MSLCNKIADAKCCVVDIAATYVDMVTFGNDTEAMLTELKLLNGYIKTLERYNTNHEKVLNKTKALTINGIAITNDGKQLLIKGCYTENVVNCLKESDVCFILEQISLSCENCKCGC